MASFFSIPSLLFLLIIVASLLVHASSSKPHQSLHLRRTRPVGFWVGLTHVDHGQNLTTVQLIQRSIHRGRHRLERFRRVLATTVPSNNMKAPVSAGHGEYLMKFTIGSPAVPVSMIMDTGSDLIWTQCQPCTTCFAQPTPIFNPVKSFTFHIISCTSKYCQAMSTVTCDHRCKYLYTYGDQTSTQGFMAKDLFIFGHMVTTHKIRFGCGGNNQGSGLGQGSGLVGLGRGPLSLVSQLGVDKFSYCLTSMGDSKILFGALSDQNETRGSTLSTPLLQNPSQPSLYYMSLQGITVGETRLPISQSTLQLNEDGSGGMILDSGTTLTYLSGDAFTALAQEFAAQTKLQVSETPAAGLDLCFESPTNVLSNVAVPKLTLHFEGLDLELPKENYMISDLATSGMVCLAMAPSSNGMSILGNLAQQNFLVVNDLGKETVSFNPTQCNKL
ncbi:hypothetical protein Vadar_002554 [Vaccinium darrowii]|uniref:Uncharacterized protein n=1 Tax=Vaccinium darrowii TaxID=229202 RepID=A0ACB7WX41_9ERIC|nr:hypothetical protein Vadar_002554 [Vaccinium darrowii]